MMRAPQSGDRINNYLLEQQVGTGSFGQVWRARHQSFGDVVAIKVPTDEAYVRNLQREGVAVHGLRHPNIVRALDMDPYGDPPYLIVEFVDGPSLRQVLDAHPTGLHPTTAVRILTGVLWALEAAHEAGLIHRDIKPANILINHPVDRLSTVTPQLVRVTDFGLGRVGGATTVSIMQSGSLSKDAGKSIAGTLAYMSPEQREGGELDARSDIYACGIVLFEMLTGTRPQGVEVPSSMQPAVPPRLDEVFRRSYTRLDRRYQSAAQMAAALTLGTHPSAVPPLPVAAARRVCRQCHGHVGDGDQFCIHCGFQLVKIVPRCPSCHAFVNASDRFCILCGTDLRRKVG